jgi:hypothetical protein
MRDRPRTTGRKVSSYRIMSFLLRYRLRWVDSVQAGAAPFSRERHAAISTLSRFRCAPRALRLDRPDRRENCGVGGTGGMHDHGIRNEIQMRRRRLDSGHRPRDFAGRVSPSNSAAPAAGSLLPARCRRAPFLYCEPRDSIMAFTVWKMM